MVMLELVVAANEIKNIPLGAIGLYSFCDKLRVGLQQLMAGTRNFSIPSISRDDLISLTEECAKVTGIPYLMDAYRQEAEAILNSWKEMSAKKGDLTGHGEIPRFLWNETAW